MLAVLGILAARHGRAEPRGDGEGGEVRIEKILATRGDLGRGRLFRKLIGRPDPPLFQRPLGVAFDEDNLIVTDPGSGRVLRIGGRGRVRRSAAELFRSPIGVASCRSGILVSDSRLGRVALLDRELRLLRWVAQDLQRPTGVACIGDRLFVIETGRHRVLALEPSGWMVPAEGLAGDTRVGERAGRSFVPAADGDALFVFEPDRVVRVLGGRGDGPGEFNFPTVIAPGLERLWVGDTLNFRIQGFEPQSGEFFFSFGRLGDSPGEMPRVKGLTVDSAGRLWISDAHLEQIAIYSPDGIFLTALGGPGRGPGTFSFPAGLAAHPDGRVAVVDSLNRRVQILRLETGPARPPGA